MPTSLHQQAKVYLVGAGPGDPELLTLKALHILQTADVILYDYLVNPEVLAHCKPEAKRVYVGKSGINGHAMSQSEIEQRLVALAQEGLTVCRLKGGDPYVFGRGGEEAQTLRAHGIPFEVVPGISSGIAAPAYAGIPVTHRSCASMVTFITGHEDPSRAQSHLDWGALSRLQGTLVFLMGVTQLNWIVSQLRQAGKPDNTPVALVRWGTRTEQETLVATLGTIDDALANHPMTPPCVIVVGEVVRLRDELNWFETLPLFGKTIVITRARTQASVLKQRLMQQGAQVLEFPTIAFEPIPDAQRLVSALRAMPQSSYDWVVFTSPNGVDAFWALLQQAGHDARWLAPSQLAAIGPGTATRLKDIGLRVDVLPDEFVAESLFIALKQAAAGLLTGKRILLPRADIARDTLPDALRGAGADVDDWAVYRTVCAPQGEDVEALIEALQTRRVDAITFSSASTAIHFAERLAPYLTLDPSLLAHPRLISIGPVTSQTMRNVVGRVDVEATVHSLDGLIDALISAITDTELTHCLEELTHDFATSS